MKRKIGSITCNWNGENLIIPHLKMLRSGGIDKSIVLQGTAPWDDYKKEHGISSKPDRSEQLIREKFPEIKIYSACQNKYDAKLYNQGFDILSDCDIVLRLDSDMFFTKKDWEIFLIFINSTEFDSYRMNFKRDSINYYMSWDYDHGLRDALEFDPLAVNPKHKLQNLVDYPMENCIIMKFSDWACHHLRGWNKPKSCPSDWHLRPKNRILPLKHGDGYGRWFKLPKEIKDGLENWHKELEGVIL